MWIDTTTDEIIRQPKPLVIDGVWDANAFKDNAKLATVGIKPYREVQVDSKYYWQGALTKVDNGTEVVGTYEAIPRDIEALKEAMKSKVSIAFKALANKPRVDTGLGYYVDGGRDNLGDFEVGKEYNLPQVKDADGNFHAINAGDYDTIIGAIKSNGLALYQEKWAKEAEIDALTTLDAIIAYEATPYTLTTLVKHTDPDTGVVTYGPETEVSVVHKDMCTYFETVIPEPDESFVSLVKVV